MPGFLYVLLSSNNSIGRDEDHLIFEELKSNSRW